MSTSLFTFVQYQPTIDEAINVGIVAFDDECVETYFTTARVLLLEPTKDVSALNDYLNELDKILKSSEDISETIKKMTQRVNSYVKFTPLRGSLDNPVDTLNVIKENRLVFLE